MVTLLKGISFRLAKVGVILAFLLGLSMSVVQLYLDFLAQQDYLDDLLMQVGEVIEPPASRAVHTLDDDLSIEVVNSLLAYEFVFEVAIEDELGNTLASGNKPRDDSATNWLTGLLLDEVKTYSADLSIPGYSRGALGRIVFNIDVDAALTDFYDRSVLVLVSGIVRNFILVFLLFFAFYQLLARPLVQMTREIRDIQTDDPGENRLTVVHPDKPDELTMLSMSVNQLMDSVQSTFDMRMEAEHGLRQSEEMIRKMVNEMPAMVVVRDITGKVLFANAMFANFCGFSETQIVGTNVFDMDFLFVGHAKEREKLISNSKKESEQMRKYEGYFHSHAGDSIFLQVQSSPIRLHDDIYVLSVMNDISERREVEEKMAYMAYHDTLTALPNRPHLVERLENEIVRARRHHYYGAVLFIDLDHFKNINDSLGHPVGDELLCKVASRLKSGVREEDVVSRLGGDEFVVVLTVLDDDYEMACLKAGEVADKLRQCICEPYPHEDISLHISCSIGVKIYGKEDTSAHELLRFADTAMYQVKNRGRNAIEFFNVEMSEKVSQQLMLEAELHTAYEQSEFVLYYQPKYCANNRQIKGAEALIRWQHPERGMIPPGQFIPQLESSGLMFDVGYWIIEEGCRTVYSLKQLGLWRDGMRMSVNISPRQLLDGNFIASVKRILDDIAVSGGELDFEVTEGVAIEDIDNTIETMKQLIDMGISFSLDDFGTGYSSISYLKRLPVENLKIDYSFIRDIEVDYSDRALVETIVTMGKLLNLNVVAEGVETVEQLNILDQFGCQFYQGYHFSKPVTKTDFTAMLEPDVS